MCAAGRRISRVLSPASRGRTISLGPMSPSASSSLPETVKARNLRGAGSPSSLLGLAPGGACHATDVAAGAVRSYRTVSTLPVPPAGAIGGLLSVALSVASRRPGVTRHPALWSSDFPRRARCAPRPSLASHYRVVKVPRRGLEPPRRLRHQILSLACLPVSAPGRVLQF
jgi:hypothetical protein